MKESVPLDDGDEQVLDYRPEQPPTDSQNPGDTTAPPTVGGPEDEIVEPPASPSPQDPGTPTEPPTQQPDLTKPAPSDLELETGEDTSVSIQALAAGCYGSSTAWRNLAIASQTGTFTAEFDAVPEAANMDGLVALSAAAGSHYSHYAVMVRFNASGAIDARNGGSYAAGTTIRYTPGSSYHFRLVVNVPARTYNVYVQPPGATEQVLGTNYAFRSEQNSVTSLANWGRIAEIGSVQVCNFMAPAETLPAALSVAPAGDLKASGNPGGPFSPSSVAYTLTNTGGQPVNWTAGKSQSWVGLSKTSGTLAVGATDTVTVSIASTAGSLPTGSHADTVAFTNTTNGSGNGSRAVNLTVNAPAGALSVSSGGLSASGKAGGPFSPNSISYTLSNPGGQPVNWTAAKTQSWVTLSKASGTLAAGATDTVAVSINSAANSLWTGSYADTITFANTTNSTGNATRSVSLAVSTPAGCLTSASSWQNVPFAAQSGSFTAEFDATPLAVGMDGVIALSTAAGSSYPSFAVLVRFNPNNAIDARNGASYAADRAIPYTPGNSYHFRVVVNVPTSTYNVYVQPPNAAEQALATNHAFRTEQSDVTGLSNWGLIVESGSVQVCNFKTTVEASPGVLSVGPAGNLAASGQPGGPFSPASATYTLTNTGGEPMNWTAAKTQDWVTLSKASGALAAGETDTVTVTVNSGADSLAAGSYNDTVTFTNTTDGSGSTTRRVSLAVNALTGALAISPAGGLTASGGVGGPFNPSGATYTLSNSGGSPVNWTAAKTQGWVTLSKTSGVLAAGATDTVTVSFNANANTLAGGTHADTVTFTNTINGSGNATRGVTLHVVPVLTIGANPASGNVPLTVQYTALEGSATASHLPTGSALNWNFGDSTPVGSGVQVSHTFTTAGSYLVALTLVLPNGLGTVACAQTTTQVTQSSSSAKPMTTASRTSGVAPLAVFFDAVNASSPAWTSGVAQPSNGDIGSLHYAWNFGDPASGNWSTTGKSRNVTTGCVAAHVYEKPGTYVAKLTVTTTTGQVTEYQQTITVQAFSGTTYYVSNTSGNDSANGTSPSTPFKTFSKAMTMLGANRRILFKRGETWSISGGTTIRAAGPGIIGAYYNSDGSDDPSRARPKITQTGTAGVFTFIQGAPDWRVMDLELAGPGLSSMEPGVAGGGSGTQARALCLRLKVQGFLFGFKHHWSSTTHDENMLVDCDWSRNGANQTGGNDMYFAGRRSVVMGCTAIGTVGTGEHNLRVWHAYKMVISNNVLSDPLSTKLALKLHNDKGVNPPDARYIVINDNKFKGTGYAVSLAPQNDQSDEKIYDVVFERNTVTFASSTQVGLFIAAQRVTVRNNVFDATNGHGQYMNALVEATAQGGAGSDRVCVYNNVFYDAGAGESFAMWMHSGGNHVVKNNLFVRTGSGTTAWYRSQSGVTESNNVLRTSAGDLVNPTGGDFHLKSTSNLINAGTPVPVFDDGDYGLPNAPLRPQGSAYDIGAYEQ